MMPKLSIVVPCYNEQQNILDFYNEALQYVQDLHVEIEFIFVDDGSKDDTLSILRSLAEKEKCVHYLSFSRNFGKEAAILGGLQFASGDAIVLIDADLQHPPSLIPEMWHYFQEGYDQVIAKRNRVGEKFIRRKLTNLYYRMVNHLIEVTVTDGVGDFRLLSRQATDALLKMTEYNRFSKGLFSWIGFHEKVIEYENQTREKGSSKWSFSSLLNYGIDGILSFNNKPLRIAIYSGLIITLFGLIYILISLIKYFIHGVDTPGYFTTISSIIVLGGMQLIFLGIIGEYIGRIYYETKRRPKFFIKEKSHKE